MIFRNTESSRPRDEGTTLSTFPRTLRILLLVFLAAGVLASLLATTRLIRSYRRTPKVVSLSPGPGEVGVATNSKVTLILDKAMDPETITPASFALHDGENRPIPSSVTYQPSSRTAILIPSRDLLPGATYQVIVPDGRAAMRDKSGHSLAGMQWKFTTGSPAAVSPAEGPGGPILVITSRENGFSEYYAEILRNEGLNEFATADVSKISASMLAGYDLVIMGEFGVTQQQSGLLAAWVHSGGNLIAMRPDAALAHTFGVDFASQEPADDAASHGAYLAINAAHAAGAGLIHSPIQIHGPSDRYEAGGGTSLATLYDDATKPTPHPAIEERRFGGGQVVLFSYDLARSVVYTRQGNPQWSGQDRDGSVPVRAEDLFLGASASDPRPDWVDRERIAIPQADLQQRLLANIILLLNAEKKPLPRFWYLPRGLKAVVVMTGDDHGSGGTVGRFEGYLKKSRPGCVLEDWECIRGTSNVFVGSIKRLEAARLESQGFEVALHVYTGCADWPTETQRNAAGGVEPRVVRVNADALYEHQLTAFSKEYPEVPAPVSNRIDCVAWGDYDTQPQVELDHGIRLDTNYYYWPPKWVRNHPGLFTGSGMPMRFARRDGRIIDVYQAATQMTDESGQVYPYTVDTLLENALGASEYYSVLTANMHHDDPKSEGADAIVASATARNVPVITAAQMLHWLDGRNASSFQELHWSSGKLEFTVRAGSGANGIQALLPASSGDGNLASLTLNGVEVDHPNRKIAGLNYAAFAVGTGKFVATYKR